MIWDGARDHDAPGAWPAWGDLDLERLARQAEAENFLPGLAEHCRRRRIIARIEAIFAGLVLAGIIAGLAL